MVQLSYPYMTTGKTIALTRRSFVGKVMSLLFNMLSRLVIAFLSRSKRLWISWLQSPFAVIFWSLPNKVCHCFHCFPIYLPWSDGPRCHDLSTLWLSSRGSLVLLCFLPKGWCHLHIWGYWYSPGNLDSTVCSSSPAFLMMYSAYKLNKQGDKIQPWCTPLPIWNSLFFHVQF